MIDLRDFVVPPAPVFPAPEIMRTQIALLCPAAQPLAFGMESEWGLRQLWLEVTERYG